MGTELTKIPVPTLAELTTDVEQAFKDDLFNLLLNQNPPEKWVKEHPFIKGYKYIPIDKTEHLLRKIFKQYRIEITGQGTSFNGVYVTVRVHFLSPVTNEWSFQDGIGAAQLQTASGKSPADLGNINNGAISMAFPIAKTVAIKDACDHFGSLFGANLNRKDVVPFNVDSVIADKAAPQIPPELEIVICEADLDNLAAIYKSNPEYHTNPKFMQLLTKRKTELNGNQSI